MNFAGSVFIAFGVIALVYWSFSRSNRVIQNLLLVLLNVVFYMLAGWEFLIPVVLVVLMNYFIGLRIGHATNSKKRKILLYAALVVYIGVFCVVRYLDIFILRLNSIIKVDGITSLEFLTDIAVPLGISIYLLNAISYLLDVYKGKIEASSDFIALAAYISFAPTMIVGPIGRAHLAFPVFLQQRTFSKELLSRGVRRMIWGIFKLGVIASNLAIYSNEVFENYGIYKGLTIFAGLLCYTFQVYAYFSGLSDIAVGAGEILGIRTNGRNFSFPFFSRNMLEFWSKWNVSLLEWLREYIFSPISGSSGKKIKIFLALVFVFVFAGLWHGGSYSFILFGFINALLVWPAFSRNGYEYPIENDRSKGLREVANLFIYLGIFLLVLLTLIFFRAETISQGVDIFKALLNDPTEISILELRSLGNSFELTLTHIVIMVFYVLLEYLQRAKDFPLDDTVVWKRTKLHWTLSFAAILTILFFAGVSEQLNLFSY